MQRTLLPAGSAATGGHVTLLKQKVLTAILRRLDALLFGKLLAGAYSSSSHSLLFLIISGKVCTQLHRTMFACHSEVNRRAGNSTMLCVAL